MRVPITLMLVVHLAVAMSAQREPQRTFEVAAIHPTPPTASSGGVRLDGAQLHMAGFSLREYVARAYRVPLSHVIGPDWMAVERFDVDATLPAGAATSQVADMLQALLAGRFGLTQHREQRDMTAYALLIGKAPLKLKESAPDPNATPRNEALVNVTVAIGSGGTSVDLGQGSSYVLEFGGRFAGKRMTADLLAATLERYSDRPIVNLTGLTGIYDVAFDVSPEEAQVLGIRAAVNAGVRLPPQATGLLDTGGNPLMAAVEQLGLKLDARKAPVEVVVVDDARRTPTEN